MHLSAEAELATELGVTPEKCAQLRRQHDWPHVRIDRFTVRYTEEQVAQIVAQMSRGAAGAGRPRLTSRSARRVS